MAVLSPYLGILEMEIVPLREGGRGGERLVANVVKFFFHFFSTSLTLLRLSWVSSSSLSRMDI